MSTKREHEQARSRRRFRLLPDGPHGWTPFAWLLYLGTFFIEPVIRTQHGQAGALYWAATIGAAILFLAAYFRGYWVRGRQLVQIIIVITALGVAFMPMNSGASVMFIYAGSFAGYLDRPRDAVRGLVLIALIAVLCGVLLDPPVWFWVTAVGITLLVGGVNLHFSQAGRAQHKLRLAQDEVEHLATVAERERIARDLHDVLGHTLSLIVLKAELAARLAQRDPARAASEIRDVEDVARRTLQDVREAIRGYRTTLADEARRAGAMLKAADIRTRFDFEQVTMSQEVEEVLALALREAVTNIVRHSEARSCRIRLGWQDGTVSLDVEDDGRGMGAAEGAGLRGMRARIEACDGTVERSSGRRGLHLRIRVPAGIRADGPGQGSRHSASA